MKPVQTLSEKCSTGNFFHRYWLLFSSVGEPSASREDHWLAHAMDCTDSAQGSDSALCKHAQSTATPQFTTTEAAQGKPPPCFTQQHAQHKPTVVTAQQLHATLPLPLKLTQGKINASQRHSQVSQGK